MPLPKSQRYIAVNSDGELMFKSRRLKMERGAYMMHGDAEISYRDPDNGTSAEPLTPSRYTQHPKPMPLNPASNPWA